MSGLWEFAAQEGASITPGALTFFDALSIAGTIASIVLAVVAMWLAVQYKRDADTTNRETSKLLGEIRGETAALTKGAWDELRAYGSVARDSFFGNRNTAPAQLTVVPPVDLTLGEQAPTPVRPTSE